MPGKEIVILGSGDIGLIMARRMTLEGATVKVVAEIMPKSGGLTRNIVQCLEDYGIPLKLNHTVIDIKGKDHIEGVTLAQVDENKDPIPGTQEAYRCDTLLLSVGLIPENELTRGLGARMDEKTHGPWWMNGCRLRWQAYLRAETCFMCMTWRTMCPRKPRKRENMLQIM